MNSIIELWTKSRNTFDTKTLTQILAFAGDGKLKDENTTSKEFRELLDQVPSKLLKQFADSCLNEKFDDGGFALQDIINQIGIRLGFAVEYGPYRGRQDDIGYDGIWKSKEGFSIIVEVKTTDAFRINLDIIAEYRSKLVEKERINKTQSSILIVVGRQDTGDLEAQIRGSRHAWDIRLLSTGSLLDLLSLKETLNDTKTIQQINELLKPKEYTRIDKLIELIFLASKDLKLDEPSDEEEKNIEVRSSKGGGAKILPVSFHDQCLVRIQKRLKINFIQQSRIAYADKEKSVGLICAVSKAHKQGKSEKFWFAFHPHQQSFLEEYSQGFVSYGCGSADNTFLIPFTDFAPLVKNMWTTENEDRMYWHVVIHQRGDKFLLAQPRNKNRDLLDISKYKLL